MKFKYLLKKTPCFLKFYRLLPSCITESPGRRESFHGNKVFQSFLKEIISSLPVSSFVETGTYKGISTKYVARLSNSISIFSCEINEDYFNQSQKRLANFKNVKLYLGSSPGFLKELTKSNRLGNLPLFYLDAHGYDYWPLEDEMDIITSFCNRAIIIIDDFEVLGRPEFGFNEQNNKICGLELIRPKMSKKNLYSTLFPFYSAKEAFPKGRPIPLRGYIIIFQNLRDEFKSIANTFSQNHQVFKVLFDN